MRILMAHGLRETQRDELHAKFIVKGWKGISLWEIVFLFVFSL